MRAQFCTFFGFSLVGLFFDLGPAFAQPPCPLPKLFKLFGQQDYSVMPPIEHSYPGSPTIITGGYSNRSQNMFETSDRFYQIEPDLSFTRFNERVIIGPEEYSPSLGFYLPEDFGEGNPYLVQIKTGKKFEIPLKNGEIIRDFSNGLKFAWNEDYSVQALVAAHYNPVSHTEVDPVFIKITESEVGLQLTRFPFQFRSKDGLGFYLGSYPTKNGEAAYITDGKCIGRLDLETGKFKDIETKVGEVNVPLAFKGVAAPGGGVLNVSYIAHGGKRYYLDFDSEKILELGPKVSDHMQMVDPQRWLPESGTWFRSGTQKNVKAAYFDLRSDNYFNIPHAGETDNFGIMSTDKKRLFGNNLYEGSIYERTASKTDLGLSWLDIETGQVNKIPIAFESFDDSQSIVDVTYSKAGYLIQLRGHSDIPSKLLVLSVDGKHSSEVAMPFDFVFLDSVLEGQAILGRTKAVTGSMGPVVAFKIDQTIPLKKNKKGQFVLEANTRPKLDQVVYPTKPWNAQVLDQMKQGAQGKGLPGVPNTEELIESMAYLKQGGCQTHPAYIGKVFAAVLEYSNVLFSKVLQEFKGCTQFLSKTDFKQVNRSVKIEAYLETRLKFIAKKERSIPDDYADLLVLRPFVEALPMEQREKMVSYLAESFSEWCSSKYNSLTNKLPSEVLQRWTTPVARRLLGFNSTPLKFESGYLPFWNGDTELKVFALSLTELNGADKNLRDFIKEYIEPLGFWVARKEIALDLKQKEHVIQWSESKSGRLTEFKLRKYNPPKVVLQAAPDYAKMWIDQKKVGLILKSKDANLLAEYMDYFKGQGFKFSETSVGTDQPLADPKKWILEKLESGELDYWLKDAHGHGESSLSFASIDGRGTLYRGIKAEVTQGKSARAEEIYIYEPDSSQNSVMIESSKIASALENRINKGAGPLLYLNTTCNSSNSVCNLYSALKPTSIVLIPSTNSIETFFNGSESGVKQLLEGVRQEKSFSEMRTAIEKKGGNEEIFLFPDQNEYFSEIQKLKAKHEVEVFEFESINP